MSHLLWDKEQSDLFWMRRLRLLVDTASGMEFLHLVLNSRTHTHTRCRAFVCIFYREGIPISYEVSTQQRAPHTRAHAQTRTDRGLFSHTGAGTQIDSSRPQESERESQLCQGASVLSRGVCSKRNARPSSCIVLLFFKRPHTRARCLHGSSSMCAVAW